MYVGPVAIFDNIPAVVFVYKSKEITCLNQSCTRYNKVKKLAKFCDECGSTLGTISKEKEYFKDSSELLEDTKFDKVFRVLNQEDSFYKESNDNISVLNERIVVGAIDDYNLSDGDKIDNNTELLFYYTIEEMLDTMRRFADQYVESLDEYVSILGPYKLVWSTNITNS